jgi:hypothetical protein
MKVPLYSVTASTLKLMIILNYFALSQLAEQTIVDRLGTGSNPVNGAIYFLTIKGCQRQPLFWKRIIISSNLPILFKLFLEL